MWISVQEREISQLCLPLGYKEWISSPGYVMRPWNVMLWNSL